MMTRVDLRRQQMGRALRWSGLLFLGYLIVTQQVMTNGPLINIDSEIAEAKRHQFTGFADFIIRKLDNLGLRGLTGTILVIAAILISRQFKSWRPLNLAVLALLSLNFVVGVSKLAIGRTKPRLNVDLIHAGGMSYPSGHASNALLSWGILAYLIYRYTHRQVFHGRVLAIIVAGLTMTVCVVSLFRVTHWFSDLVGGLFIGGSLLVLIIAIDRYFPSERQPS
ncbi:MAG: phosphatase PAP2 family protein [Candidatus Nanopelagicaceae bacterium]|nr:phosphatase PAP2 family protein [Candidatus Nanopelagicaceae bacterium]